MKRIIIIPMLLLLILADETVRTQEYSITTGVIAFHGGKEAAGKSAAVAAELGEVLARYRFITLVERAKLDSLVKEIELGQSGLVDDAAAAKAGRMRGCKILVTGTIRDSRVTARAIHTETAKVITSGSAEMSGIGELGKRLASGIESHLARESLRTLRNDSPDIDLEFRAEGGRGKKLITPRATGSVKIGDPVIFRFKSSMRGYLTIVDVQPGGDVVLLFPNDMSPSNEVRAGIEYSIPGNDDEFEITATEPAGRDTVVAFFTAKKVEWLDMKKLAGTGFRTVREGERAFAARGFAVTATRLRKSEWESAILEIDVK
jgi:hypothetical protein